MGPINAAVTTSAALTALRPKRVLLVGICAGIADDVRLGDICVSDQVVDYDLGKVRDGKYTPRWRTFPSDADLVRAARNFTDPSWASTIVTPRPDADGSDPQVHVGTVLSGSKIVADLTMVDALQSVWTQAVGLEMEGGGSAAAAHEHATHPSFILIKGVCDRATAEKNDDWQEYAADAAGRYAISLIINRGGDVGLKTPGAAPVVQRADALAQLGLTRAELLAMLTTGLNVFALQQLCFELDLEWEDLPGRTTKSGAAMDIISAFTRRKELTRLLGYLKEKHSTLF